MNSNQASIEERALIMAPTGRDATLICTILTETGIECSICAEPKQLHKEIDAGAGAVIVAEEALTGGARETLADYTAGQPSWSDLPIVILTQAGADSALVRGAIETLGNVSLIERPTRTAALISIVRTALRARRRQYQIRSQQESLREASRRKDEFLATLAHELRNPLAPIQNAVNLLRMENLSDADLQHIGDLIGRQALQLRQLIDDLLDISRITRGEIVVRKQRVELSTIIRDAVETSRPLIDASEHEFYVTQRTEPLFVEADPVRIAQSISNLLNNAAKYTPARGRIFLDVQQEGEQVILHVRDTGIGISPDMLPHVFGMFTQADETSGRSRGGLGIGLWLVKRIAEAHGGTVQARSAGAGFGSEFIVRLPIVASLQTPAPSPAEPTVEIQTEHSAGHRILVVDDNRDSADSLSTMLAMAGNEVSTAYDGLEAVKAVSSFHPDVALLDIGLPKLDGYEAARQIRKQPGGKDIVLIAVSGWGRDEDKRRSLDAGFNYYFVKPMDARALESVLVKAPKHDHRQPSIQHDGR